MKTIKDSVHDHISIDDLALDILDTPEMQRLRHIRQMGTAYLVYPSANHTRFEHSLGVYHLAVQALDTLNIDDNILEDEVRAAALLHDVGHTPFSHGIEDIVHEETGKWHDDVRDILEGDIARILEENYLNVDKVAKLIKGKGKLGQLISGELDVDRMDYLVRDAHHTGVPYGTIDNIRLVLELEFVNEELVLGEGNVQTAEALLLARALMHPTVYNHHVARISNKMLERATQRLIDKDNGVSAERIRRMDDHELIVALRETEETRDLAQRLMERRLYKRAVWMPYDAVSPDVFETTARELEEEISDKTGVSQEGIIVDTSQPPEMTESSARVIVDGEIRLLENVSPLVKTLREAHKQQWRFGVYCPEDNIEEVGKAAKKII